MLRGYTISPYLPELHGAPTHPHASGRPDPVLAKQEILSLPETPDNLHQTIVAPPKIKLKQDVDLPNIVAYQTTVPVQPLAASERDSAKLRLPNFMPEVIRPAVDSNALRSRSKLPAFEPQVVEPAPEVAQANLRHALPAFQPKVVEPAPDLGRVSRGNSAVLAHLAPRIAEPIPEAPHLPEAQRMAGQIIALNLHPADVHAPVNFRPATAREPLLRRPPDTPRPAEPQAPVSPPEPAHTNPKLRSTPPPASVWPLRLCQTAWSPHPMRLPTKPPIPMCAPNSWLRCTLRRCPSRHVNPWHANPPDPARIWRIGSLPAAAPTPFPSTCPTSTLPPVAGLSTSQSAAENTAQARTLLPSLRPRWSANLTRLIRATSCKMACKAPSCSPPPFAPMAASATSRSPKALIRVLIRMPAEALSRWLFRPALKDGRAIDLEAVIAVPFHLKAAGLR